LVIKRKCGIKSSLEWSFARREDGMKGMKKILMVLMVLGMVVVFVGQASAEMTKCEVEQAGYNLNPGEDGLEIKLRYVLKTSGRIFNVSAAATTDAQMNRMLAIALTALTNGWQVKADIDWNGYDSTPGAMNEILNMKLIVPAP